MVHDEWGKPITIIVHDVVHSRESPISLCSRIQTKESGISIESIWQQTPTCSWQVLWYTGHLPQWSYWHHHTHKDPSSTPFLFPTLVHGAGQRFAHVIYDQQLTMGAPKCFYDADNPINLIVTHKLAAYTATNSTPASSLMAMTNHTPLLLQTYQ